MPRAALSIALGALALSACGKGDKAGGGNAAADTVSAQDFEVSDVTAIDAATGADANMAEDIDVNAYSPEGNRDGEAKATGSRPRPAQRSTPSDSAGGEPEVTQPVDSPAETPPAGNSN